MRLDTIYRMGSKKVWELDEAAQFKFLAVIAEARGMSVDFLKSTGAFFVPNDGYMISRFGNDISNAEYGCYTASGLCRWCNCLLIPVKNLANSVVGFVSFNPFSYADAHETKDYSISYYAYSPKDVFPKGRYLYYTEGTYRQALQDGYLILVDGVFDAISLSAEGFLAAATMGSALTNEILMQLRFVKRIIHIADNDEAGYKVYESLRKHLNNVELFKQCHTKDADDLLKTQYKGEFIKSLKYTIRIGHAPINLITF